MSGQGVYKVLSRRSSEISPVERDQQTVSLLQPRDFVRFVDGALPWIYRTYSWL